MYKNINTSKTLSDFIKDYKERGFEHIKDNFLKKDGKIYKLMLMGIPQVRLKEVMLGDEKDIDINKL